MSVWNGFTTDAVPSIIAGSVMITSGQGDEIQAYHARPDGGGPYPGIVITMHPMFDEFLMEMARRFAFHGFSTMVPNMFYRYGAGTPDDQAAKVRTDGGISDDSAVADAQGAMRYLKSLPNSNGKVGVIGPCAGGRLAVLVASRTPEIDAVVDLWGGRVVATPDQLNEKQPVAVIDLTPNLNAPLLGIFGNDDTGPSPAQVDQHEAALRDNGKAYMFHRYDGAGHGMWYLDRTNYRQQQAMDGWNKVLTFFGQYLA